ncbi:MAG: ABC transporter permease [Zavarzinella sp.]
MIRFRILKALFLKEALRHTTNRGGLVLAGLLIAASLILAVLNPAEKDQPSNLIAGIHHCYIYYDTSDEWVEHLINHVPPGLKNHLFFKQIPDDIPPDEKIRYVNGTGGIELRTLPPEGKFRKKRIWLRFPDGERAGMAVYEQWFWRESYRFLSQQMLNEQANNTLMKREVVRPAHTDDQLWAQREAFNQLFAQYYDRAIDNNLPVVPKLDLQESAISNGSLDFRAAIATALVMFSLFFTCVYLMPSFTCEEREKGMLLAQALSPATTFEILLAKFLFYPAFGVILATLLAGIHNSNVLKSVFFWLTLLTLSVGTLGIGITISSLARTQRSASLAALCYMLAIALVMLLCQQNNIEYIPQLAIEYHAPHLLHAILTDQLRSHHWLNLTAAIILSVSWVILAAVLFRRRGWQ